MRYVCTNCGGNRTVVLKHRPALDDRYAVGYCGDEQGDGKIVRGCSGTAENRIVRQLCRADMWDPETLERGKQAKADHLLLQRVTGPRLSRKRDGMILPPAPVTDAERQRAHEIQRRQTAQWGDQGDLDVQEEAFPK